MHHYAKIFKPHFSNPATRILNHYNKSQNIHPVSSQIFVVYLLITRKRVWKEMDAGKNLASENETDE
jgi:hypothetical protein